MAPPAKSSMSIRLLFCLFVHLHSLAAHNISSAQKGPRCHQDEMSALLEFKDSFELANVSDDPLAYPKIKSWKNDGNKSDADCCMWDGVECNEQGHVIALDLSSSLLFGSINSSSSLFRLIHLERLNLAHNNFNYSAMPLGFGLLARLTYLNLSASSFAGQVPSDVLSLTRLVSLDLSDNFDQDKKGLLVLRNPGLESLVQNMTHLQGLNLGYVDISSPVPITLADLPSLRQLYLYECGLYGAFPQQIFQLPDLQYLDICHNDNLTGYLPEFSMSSPLKSLVLRNTSFSGKLPVSIGNLSSLSHLDILGCGFSGSIPSSLGKLDKLNYLNVGNNQFSPQPFLSLSWLWRMTNLTTLILDEINLQGSIPPSVGNLSHLVNLKVRDNHLTGSTSIPPQVMNLTKLEVISLHGNELSGGIPSWLMNMTQLNVLDLAYNRFTGEIPKSVFQLRHLEVLSVNHNDLTGAIELDSFLELKKLVFLELSWNWLLVMASTKTQIRNIPQLKLLGLASCNLTTFPGFLQHQEELQWISVASNNIRGDVPTWIWNLSPNTLNFVDLSGNFLTGQYHSQTTLPQKYLYKLDLSKNKLKGPLPAPPTSIRRYVVSQNELEGEFPYFICKLSSLIELDLSFNNITALLPGCLWDVNKSLSILSLQSNGFHGSIPEFSVSGSQLRMIDLSQNQLEGKLPRSLANCPVLEFINLYNNQIDDTFPYWLGSLPELRVLILRSNKFRGALERPSNDSAFPKLRIFDLSQNSFYGKLSEDYFQSWKAMRMVASLEDKLTYLEYHQETRSSGSQSITYKSDYHYTMTVIYKGLRQYYPKISDILTIIDFSSNALEGKIPEVVGQLKGLQGLNFSSNFLSGHIPSSLGNLTALESLDLSNNKLSGRIPETLMQVTSLSFLNLSDNDLTGPIPRGKQFDTFPSTSYEGNPGLCGEPISKKCENAGDSPQHHDNDDSDISDELFWIIAFLGYGIGLFVGAVMANVFTSSKQAWFESNFHRIRRLLRGRTRSARSCST